MEHNRVIYTRPYNSEIEYLESVVNSTNKTYINTQINASSSLKIEIKAQRSRPDRASDAIYGGGINTDSNLLGVLPHKNTEVLIYWGNRSKALSIYNNFSQPWVIINENGIFNINGTEYEVTNNDFSYDYPIFLFCKNFAGIPHRLGTGFIRIFYCKIWDNNVLVRDLIPVRVGSVGYMYDKVSGQLFGNAGTGYFVLGRDVSNPVRRVFRFDNKRYVVPSGLEEGVDYVKADWLKGDGKIQTKTITNTIEFFDMYAKLPSNNRSNYVVFGELYSENQNSFRSIIRFKNFADITFMINRNLNAPLLINHHSLTGKVIHWNYTKPIATLEFNNQVVRQSTNVVSGNKPLVLCNRVSTNTSPLTIGRTVINDNTFTPCKLLRSIPASFDANGIARQIGECGMVDLLSGKFYGNVASSGSFTVENDND